MRFPPEINFRRSGLRSGVRSPIPRRGWNLAVRAWLILILGVFVWLRILQSETVTQLLEKFTRH